MSRRAWVPSKRWAPFSMAVVCVLGLVTAVGARTSKIALAMKEGEIGGLYVMDAVPGSTPILLNESYWSPVGWLKASGDPDWSPDGREIVFSKHDASGAKHYVDIWIIGADGSNAREILRQERVDGREDVFPMYRETAWSPDGSLIAVSSYATLYFVRPDGVLASRIGRWGRFPDWTPDGRHIVHVGRVGSSWGILILEADGIRGVFGRERLIYEGPASRVQVSPDGSRIAFDAPAPRDPETGREGRQIGVVDLDGSNVRFLAEGRNPCWSPDSRHIAFVEFDETDRPHALKVVDADGSNPRVLLESSGRIGSPAWSPLLPAETATPASSWGEVKHRHRSR